jgi:hypothetical protein
MQLYIASKPFMSILLFHSTFANDFEVLNSRTQSNPPQSFLEFFPRYSFQVGYTFFGSDHPDLFGNYTASMLTLVQVHLLTICYTLYDLTLQLV